MKTRIGASREPMIIEEIIDLSGSSAKNMMAKVEAIRE